MINLNDRFVTLEIKKFTVWMDEGEGWFIHSSWDTEKDAQFIVDRNSYDGVYCYIDYPDGYESE